MFESICVAVILAFFVRTFVVQAFKIPSGSMEPNLLIGDHLLVNKFVAAPTLTRAEDTLLPIETIHRGDIIVFKHPRMPERDLIKRTIGLPGRDDRAARPARLRQRKAARRTLRPLPVQGARRCAAGGRAPELWPRHRARRAVLHDGRQPG
jgi:hypothetical protein